MLYSQRHVLNRQYQGFSVVEFMVALVLSSLLTITLIEIFMSNKSSFRISDGLVQMQDNIRIASDALNRDIRMATYSGCGNLENINVTNNVATPSPKISLTNDDSIKGHESTGLSTWSPNLGTDISGQVADGTDVIEVHKASESSEPLTKNMASTLDLVEIANRENIQANDIVFITDCQTGDIFQVTSITSGTMLVHAPPNNLTVDLSKAYNTEAHVMSFTANTYYIKDSGRTNQAGDPIFSLFRRDVNNNETEIVQGVENMQITYGLDSNEDDAVDSFSDASTIDAANNWAQVKSVRISLLFTSIEGVSPTPQDYTFNGTTTTPTDRMLRRQHDLYITLRNRGL